MATAFGTRIRYQPPYNVLAHAGLTGVAVYAWGQGLWYVTAAAWLLMAYFANAILVAFHEAVHGHLAKRHWDNEVRGTILGTFLLMPLSVYRHLHLYHHARLAREQDMELWPYVDTRVPRPVRLAAAWGELLLGYLVTPLIFLRGVIVQPPRSRGVRRRIVAEYVLIAFAVVATLLTCHYFGLWELFLIGYLVPAVLTGNLQAARKFTEHMGLFGSTPMTASRTIVPVGVVPKAVTVPLLNVNYHGTHHRYGTLPYRELPTMTPRAVADEPSEAPVFANYRGAFLDCLPALRDPKIGPQWLRAESEVSSPANDLN